LQSRLYRERIFSSVNAYELIMNRIVLRAS